MKKLIALLLILPALTFSQVDGIINGYIYDSKSQLPLLGANVIIEGTEKGAISDENGFFQISEIMDIFLKEIFFLKMKYQS